MKKTLGLLLIFFTFGQTFAVANTVAIECFRFQTNIPSSQIGNSNTYITSPYKDIYAQQGGNTLSVANIDRAYKYIPFSVDIDQSDKNGIYENTYNFTEIDSDQIREINLSFEETLQSNSFIFNAQFESQYYSPKYYFSENGSNYSLVLKNDISDFDITNIRIVFEAIGELPVREKIKISELSLLNKDSFFLLSPTDSTAPINLHAGNSCSKTVINNAENIIYNAEIEFIPSLFTENSLYNANNTDSDGDGISDLDDNCVNIVNSNQEDINSNGIGDACEFDSDGDGVSDSIDNCRNTPNPLQLDDDNDTLGNSCDNCGLYNPDQRDANNDGIGDVCESEANYLSENDDDGDLVINFRDNCRYVANPDQKDSESDGVGDACDNCNIYKNPQQEDLNNNGIGDICEDIDADGIDGLRDNCPNIPNPDQADRDNDGIGNLCEDDDNDAIIFVDDNCPYVFNPDQKDRDNDGLGDLCDESDDRILESNKTVFIILILLIIIGFCIGIFSVMRQLKK